MFLYQRSTVASSRSTRCFATRLRMGVEALEAGTRTMGRSWTPEIHIGSEPEKEWVRPDLNRSRQHPKLVGFPVGRKTVTSPGPNQATPRTRSTREPRRGLRSIREA